jgi:hypothetical protein
MVSHLTGGTGRKAPRPIDAEEFGSDDRWGRMKKKFAEMKVRWDEAKQDYVAD